MTDFADGEWHRLHRATPLFRGGLALLIIIGILFGNLRDRFIDLVFGDSPFDGSSAGDHDYEAEAFEFLIRENLLLLALAGLLVLLALITAGFWLSWRLHTFRITDEVVEVRSGILFRTNRKGRLDRIQGINIARPFIPRLFGAAKLEISVAGNDANVQLSYLRSADADALRREILLLASGARRHASAADGSAGEQPPGTAAAVEHPDAAPGATADRAGVGALLEDRAREFLAPELDPTLVVEPESVVRMNVGRLIGSTVLSDAAIALVLGTAALITAIVVTGEVLLVFGVLPALLGIGGFLIARITRSLRYTIASTPDGVRVGFGLLSTTNETLPPGRIHSVRVTQPLLWRPFGWWQIAVNRASRSSQQGAAGQQQTTILPVGNLDDVRAVLRLLLPEVATDEALPLLERGLLSPGGDDGYTNSPRRARALRWFSQPRNGFALTDTGVLLRTGAIWRALTVVPFARVQSVSVRQGPVLRPLRLAAVHVHTVSGPISPRLGAIDREEGIRFFGLVTAEAIRSGVADTSHRWRASAAPADGATA